MMNNMKNFTKARDLLLTFQQTLGELRELYREDDCIYTELEAVDWPNSETFEDFAYRACESARNACTVIIHESAIRGMQNILMCSFMNDVEIMNAIVILRGRERKRLGLDDEE